MAADNWEHCPKCALNHDKDIKAQEAKTKEAYGTVPIEVFDKMRLDLANAKSSLRSKTLREDYDVTGASEGQVNFAYTASCKVCGLRVKFDDSHIIPGL